MDSKRLYGQFYTVTNPFHLEPFIQWYNKIPDISSQIIVEPFSGANSIIKLIEETSIQQPKSWDCFDIDPPKESYGNYSICKKDTLSNFPTGYKVAITNPPYLARNSATRRGLKYPNTDYDDVYKEALHQMLTYCDYVAAIIPESFITSELFLNRLDCVISLTMKMFSDTEVPVCLALFSPHSNDNSSVFRNNLYLGTLSDLKNKKQLLSINGDKELALSRQWRFNDPNGWLGARLVDDTKGESISFVKGDEISPDLVKVSSRMITRISGHEKINQDELIKEVNQLLHHYREQTEDVFMTSFKGLRDDGKYRRRMDYKSVRSLLTRALVNLSQRDIIKNDKREEQ